MASNSVVVAYIRLSKDLNIGPFYLCVIGSAGHAMLNHAWPK